MIKRWQFWVGAVISALFLVIALRGLHLGDIWGTIETAQLWWLVPGVLVYFAAVWARVWRWHYLLRPIKVISLRNMWPATVIGYMGNNIYPFRAGEVIRAYVIRRNENVSMGTGLATVVVERVFDGLVMLMFVFVALPAIPNLPNWLRQTVILASLAFMAALLMFFLWAARQDDARRLYSWFIQRLTPARFHERLLALADNFTSGLSSLRQARDVAMVFVTSVVIWLLETIKYWFVMHAFDFTVDFLALMLMNGVVNLATTIPSAPGYIGTFDGPGIEVLRVFGVDPVIAAGYTLTLHAALWLPITLLGFWYMARQSMTWHEISEAAKQKETLAQNQYDSQV